VRTAQEILTEFQMVHCFDPALAGQRAEQELMELLNKARGKNGATDEESVHAAETIADLLLGETEEWHLNEQGYMPYRDLKFRARHLLERLRKANK
jgi:hypothetical protein